MTPPPTVKFVARLELVDPHYPSTTFAIIPPKTIDALGGGGRIPIAGTINGFKFRTTICRMWGKMLFCVNKEMRDGGKTGVGKVARFVVERDEKPRMVNLQADVKKALGKELTKRFMGMSYTHQREWARAIADAKKPETRRTRVAKLIDAMRKRI